MTRESYTCAQSAQKERLLKKTCRIALIYDWSAFMPLLCSWIYCASCVRLTAVSVITRHAYCNRCAWSTRIKHLVNIELCTTVVDKRLSGDGRVSSPSQTLVRIHGLTDLHDDKQILRVFSKFWRFSVLPIATLLEWTMSHIYRSLANVIAFDQREATRKNVFSFFFSWPWVIRKSKIYININKYYGFYQNFKTFRHFKQVIGGDYFSHSQYQHILW